LWSAASAAQDTLKKNVDKVKEQYEKNLAIKQEQERIREEQLKKEQKRQAKIAKSKEE